MAIINMKKLLFKNYKKGGYALLFTIIIIGIISAVTAGISSSSYKQMVLSSLAKDSQTAFYQADTASDCAFYAELVKTENEPNFFKENSKWICGETDLDIIFKDDGFGSYLLDPPQAISDSNSSCFRISVTKDAFGTEIIARGYNICNKSNPRTVEREIEINY